MTGLICRWRGGAGGMLLLTAGLVGICWSWTRPLTVGAKPANSESMATPPSFPWQGAITCASASCHNAQGSRGIKGSEYSTWITDDPHHRAYAALFNKQSLIIEKNLGHHEDGRTAANDLRCLRCHDHVNGSSTSSNANLASGEGVSCESCHGSAGLWRSQHFLPGWRQKSAENKEQLGMLATKDLAVRARVCIECHVGSGDRDVNHDLIAAGHPRLNFEYSAFLAVLPKHWSEAEDKARYPDLEARAWILGQVSSAQAALQLLAYRAKDHEASEPGPKKTWPEFSEYNCFACHHDLEGKSWRQKRDLARLKAPNANQAKAGFLPWGTWYMTMLPQALTTQPSNLQAVMNDLKKLRTEMEKPSPNREKVAGEAESAAKELGVLAKVLTGEDYAGKAFLRDHLSLVAGEEQQLDKAGWDGAAQLYLALAALYHAQADLYPQESDPRVKDDIEMLGRLLRFPRLRSITYNSPQEANYPGNEAEFRGTLHNLETILKGPDR